MKNLKTTVACIFTMLLTSVMFAQNLTDAKVIGVIPIGNEEIISIADNANIARYKSELVSGGQFQVSDDVQIEDVIGVENKYKIHKINLGQTVFASKYYISSNYKIHPLREEFLIRVNTEMSKEDLYALYTAEQKYIIWNDKLEQVLSTEEFQNFTTQQKSFVVRQKNKISIDAFEIDSKENELIKKYIDAQLQAGVKMFDNETIYSILYTLDDYPKFDFIPTRGGSCDCNIGSVTTPTCGVPKNGCDEGHGCGALFLFKCNGVLFPNVSFH